MGMTIYRNNKPVILVDRHIGNDPIYGPGIMGADYTRELTALENAGHPECEVWINSIGGGVMDAMDMYNANVTVNKAGKMKVNTRCVGVAASSAGFFFQSGHKRIMNDYALLMMHNASGGDEKTLETINGSIVTMLSTRCSKSELQISNMMEKETWLDSSECKAVGLCDEIEISIEVEKEEMKNKSPYAVYNKLRAVVNKLIETPKIIKMKKVTNALKLNEDANEEAILAEVSKLQEQITNLTGKVTEKETELANIKTAKETADKEAAAVEVVTNACNEGRIEADAKDGFIALAKMDLEGVKNTLAKMPVKKTAVKLPIENKGAEGRASWTYEDWESKDATGLTNMYKNHRESYDLLLNKWKESKNTK
jgi:ATP-dependent protease ClpP protease subunit